MKIIMMGAEHWDEVKSIYWSGIKTGQATFEESPPDSWQKWSQKFLNDLSLVCLEGNKVLGWAAISRVSTRKVYQGVGELSIYVDPDSQGQGLGKMLMDKIISESERAGFWTLQASIFPENLSSINLHLSSGFRVVGERSKIGKMTYGPEAGKWRDVIFLERRKSEDGNLPDQGKKI
jgi:L-amino acid N-acyltransferase YncA